MYQFPKDPRKVKARIRRYEREMRKEYEKFGSIRDGYGKRYLLGALYLILDDVAGALESFAWYEKMFPNDMGDPLHYLCWTLALYRSADKERASVKLQQAMLSNLYMIPHLLDRPQEPLDMWHASNLAEKDFLQCIPAEIWALWDESALEWVQEVYDSLEFRRVRDRYIQISKELETEERGPRRSQLVSEMFELLTAGEDTQ